MIEDDPAPTPPSSVFLLPEGARLGPYVIQGMLGSGGMSSVFRARHEHLGRDVALKVIRPDLPPATNERLRREAQALARASHANIVTIYDTGVADGLTFIAMELIEGETLADRIKRGGRAREFATILEKVVRAIAHAHAHGVIHRDLKPSNILIDRKGQPKLADFGLAHLSNASRSLTRTGAHIGTPQYMAPEQVEGGEADERTDLWALGVILYEAITGQPPFVAPTIEGLYYRILNTDPPESSRDIPAALAIIAQKCMHKDRGARYQRAIDLADDLRRFLEGEPISARRAGVPARAMRWARRHRVVVGGILLAAAGLAFGGLQLAGRWRERREAARREEELRAAAARRESALRDLNMLWTKVLLAKQGYYMPIARPVVVRAELEEAIAGVTRHIEAWPEQPQGYYIRARGRTYLGDRAGAEKDLREALRLEPAFTPAWALLAKIRVDVAAIVPTPAGIEEAKEALRKSGERLDVERWGLARTSEDDTAALIVQALWVLYVDGDDARARTLLRGGLDRKGAEECCLWLAWLEDDRAEHLRLVEQALKIMPHYAQALMYLAMRKADTGDFAGAIEAYTRVIEIDPRLPYVYSNRAIARIDMGDPRGAIEDATKALEVNPDDHVALMNRAQAYLDLNDPRRALSDAQRVIDLHPESSDGYVGRGTARAALDDVNGALEDMAHALERGPRRPVEIYTFRAHLLLGAGRIEEALDDAERAVEASPEFGKAWYLRAQVRERLGRRREAVADYERAARLLPPGSGMRAQVEERLERLKRGE